METTRILIPGDDQSVDSILQALIQAASICQKSEGAIKEAILFIPVKDLILSSTLSAAIGEVNAKILHSGGHVPLTAGVKLRLETQRTLRSIIKPSVLVAVYADQDMLDVADAANSLRGIVAVPHRPEALDRWKSTWSPIVYGEPMKEPQQLIDDPVFEQGLFSITRSVNLSHTLMNTRDKEYADRTLRILRAHGHIQDATRIQSWAIRNKWHPKAAEELGKLALKVQSLKAKPKLSEPDQAAKVYAHWCNQVKV